MFARAYLSTTVTWPERTSYIILLWFCVWQIYFSIICGSETGQVEFHVLLLERKMKVDSLPLWFVASQSFEWVSTNTQHPFSLHLSAIMSALTGKKQLCIDRNHLQLSSVYHITAVFTGGRLRCEKTGRIATSLFRWYGRLVITMYSSILNTKQFPSINPNLLSGNKCNSEF